MDSPITYPQYRKYHNGHAFFKIISSTEWEEIRILGSRYVLHKFKVQILPDRNYLHDMTFDHSRNWEKIEEAEYEEIKGKVKAD